MHTKHWEPYWWWMKELVWAIRPRSNVTTVLRIKMNEKILTVYKASAGSGKTFTLAVEYIKLLIQDPTAYDTVLAVTFTNKATEEMKQRILSQLYGIWKGLDDSRTYHKRISQATGLPDGEIRRRAGLALQGLLHHYCNFHVETIDSFFQKVVRNLGRELDLTASLRVTLNNKQIEEEAVDALIDALHPAAPLLAWILDFVERNLEEDKSWNVIGKLKRFGQSIFSDSYQKEGEALSRCMDDATFFEQYARKMRTMQQQARQTMADFASRFEALLADEGLNANDLKNSRNGMGSYFRKLKGDDWSDKKCLNKTVEESLMSAENWATKTSRNRQAITELAERALIPLLKEAESARRKEWRQFVSAQLTMQHINELRLLSTIEREVARINAEAGQFLLSNTQTLLREMIGSSDAPFIYEKTGTRLEHIMIDEMQDTSKVQWENFKVLLNEVMAGGHGPGNLLVGDVKQSIYRWRGGDWRLLNSIEKEFDDKGDLVEVKPLDVNWRSTRNVVAFNNAFFQKAAALAYEEEVESSALPLCSAENSYQGNGGSASVHTDEQNRLPLHDISAEQIKKAYGHVVQKVPEQKREEGIVRVTLLPKKEYNDGMLEAIWQQVDELLSNGIAPKDIAILVRANKHIPLIAEFFMKRNGPLVVSDEAFRLDASFAVRMLVNALKALVRPDDMLAKGFVVQGKKRIEHREWNAEDGETEDNVLFSDEEREELLRMPVNDLCEELYKRQRLERAEGQAPYIAAFFDGVDAFAEDHGTDITALLSYWDDNMHKKTIQTSVVEGIRIISIHKSKGLEFDHVIIPYCNWQLVKNDASIWCYPTSAPYNALPMVCVDYSGKLADSIYADDYREEHLQYTVDNLNLLYVAFTRAAKSLFVIGCRDGISGYRCKLVEQTLHALKNDVQEEGSLSGLQVTGEENKEEALVYEYGSLSSLLQEDKEQEKKGKKEVANVFTVSEEQLPVSIESFASNIDFRQSNRSREFVEEETDDTSEATRQNMEYIKTGNMLHKIFSMIRTIDDVPEVVRQMEFEGVLADSGTTAEKLKDLIVKRLKTPRIQEWFSDKWQLFNECTILALDKEGQLKERRPDRVMTDGQQTIVVDFKFGTPLDEHHEQVRQYMSLLKKMGMPSVSGVLWYVYNNMVVEVG